MLDTHCSCIPQICFYSLYNSFIANEKYIHVGAWQLSHSKITKTKTHSLEVRFYMYVLNYLPHHKSFEY